MRLTERMQDNKGFTLTELLVTLFILAIVSSGAIVIGVKTSQMSERKAFESECDLLLEKVLALQQDALMLDNPPDKETTATMRNEALITSTYQHGRKVSQVTRFQHMMMHDYYGDEAQIIFTRDGVTKKGTTVCLTSKIGVIKYLIVQPVSGRIHLSDTPP